jgi:hypothetical protein
MIDQGLEWYNAFSQDHHAGFFFYYKETLTVSRTSSRTLIQGESTAKYPTMYQMSMLTRWRHGLSWKRMIHPREP